MKLSSVSFTLIYKVNTDCVTQYILSFSKYGSLSCGCSGSVVSTNTIHGLSFSAMSCTCHSVHTNDHWLFIVHVIQLLHYRYDKTEPHVNDQQEV